MHLGLKKYDLEIFSGMGVRVSCSLTYVAENGRGLLNLLPQLC